MYMDPDDIRRYENGRNLSDRRHVSDRIGATVNYNADAKALHILFKAPKSVGDKVQIPQGSTLTDPDGNGVKFSESVTLTLTRRRLDFGRIA